MPDRCQREIVRIEVVALLNFLPRRDPLFFFPTSVNADHRMMLLDTLCFFVYSRN